MAEEKDKLTIVMFSGDLDHALAGFTLATTAASMGVEEEGGEIKVYVKKTHP